MTSSLGWPAWAPAGDGAAVAAAPSLAAVAAATAAASSLAAAAAAVAPSLVVSGFAWRCATQKSERYAGGWSGVLIHPEIDVVVTYSSDLLVTTMSLSITTNNRRHLLIIVSNRQTVKPRLNRLLVCIYMAHRVYYAILSKGWRVVMAHRDATSGRAS